jgi:hypothetical protein
MAAISANGGMSMTNGYDVQFDFGNITGTLADNFKKLKIDVKSANDSGQPGSLINLFCDEAQLPNMQFATGQINGKYLGSGSLTYPHTKLISDFSLTWMCDANMAPYKFLITWWNFIQGETTNVESADRLRNIKSAAKPLELNKAYRINYPKDYQCILRIAKTEKGQNAPNSRVPLVYAMSGVYPYSIDAVPLSYGTSQITRVTANFYYEKISTYLADIRKYKG